MGSSKRVLTYLALGASAVLLGYWGLMYSVQRSMMYPAPPVAGAPARPADAQQIWLDTPGARVEAWYLPARGSTKAAPLFIYTHGNGELIDVWPEAFEEPRDWGVAALLVEYPGYGRSSGSPSQDSITKAVLAAYDWALEQPGVDPKRVIAYGRSLGGGPACVLAEKRSVAALILESTFTSVRSFARGFGAPGAFVRDPFDNLSVVREFKGPLLITHGVYDEVIPVRHGRDLAAAAPQAEFHQLNCGHNDCDKPWNFVRAFLIAHDLLPKDL